METLWQDLRYGARMLRKSPGFTAIAVITLALGIGANTSLFSVVNAVLLNPLPYHNPEQLAILYSKTADFQQSSTSYPNFLDWQKENRTFSALAAFRSDDFNLTGQGEAERLRGYMISSGFLSILGVNPIMGRNFRAEEDRVGATPVVLVSSALWKRKFNAEPDVLGKTMVLNGVSYTILGVLPAEFRLYSERDVYVPIGLWNDPAFRDRRISMGMNVLGRFKPGVTLGQARVDLATVAQNLGKAYPEADTGAGITVVPLKADMVGDIQPFLLVLLGAVGFVLLIACANVANLLLARATGRTREFAIRAALGAGRGRVIRQLLTESISLSLSGGALGLLLAWRGTRMVLAAVPQALPRSHEIGLDPRVLLFTGVVSLCSGILFGLVPALRIWHGNVHSVLKEGVRGSSGRQNRAQSVFVMLEMALALVLLVGAGLMIRSLARLWSVDPGFNPNNVLTFSVTLPNSLGTDPATIRAALHSLHDHISAVPGVETVSITGGSLPMTGDSELPFWLEGQPKPANQNEMTFGLFYLIEPEYLQTMGIPLQRGRFVMEKDKELAPNVIVIDEAFARKFFPNQNPIGKRLNLGLLDQQPEIVGVVGHVKHWGLDTEGREAIASQMYIPFYQIPDKFMPLVAHGIGVVIRSHGDPQALVGRIRQAVGQLNSQQVVYDVQTMNQIVSDSLAARRFAMVLLAMFAALAVALSSIGIYGVISYLVGQRTQEIGIRMALGAQRTDVLRLVVGHATRMALIGVAIGVVAALALTRLMTTMLFGITAHDPLTFIGVTILLLLLAIVACYIPAIRAMRVNPVTALRYE